jgi:hypothetical protein
MAGDVGTVNVTFKGTVRRKRPPDAPWRLPFGGPPLISQTESRMLELPGVVSHGRVEAFPVIADLTSRPAGRRL